MSYEKHFSTKETPQSQPIPGSNQVPNNAGGFAFAVDDWVRLDRFLVLGAEGGTYYVSERELTVRNAEAVLRCVKQDGQRVVVQTVAISEEGRAPKNDSALFVLAMCASMGDEDTRKTAFAALPRVARIGTHLFHFVRYAEAMRGWGRGMRTAIQDWYNDMPLDRLAYQAVKYQQRDGWSHADLLRLAHPKAFEPVRNDLYKWIVDAEVPQPSEPLQIIHGYEALKADGVTAANVIDCIRDYGLTREMVPTQFLNDPRVWDALLQKMPMTAMIRNLGKMTSVGLLAPMSNAVKTVVTRLGDAEYLRKSRVHPLSVLVALRTYEQGHGMRGRLIWVADGQIVDALDAAFYASFDNVVPTNKRLMLALDVSGSMTYCSVAGMPLTPRVGSAAMALVTAATEPHYCFRAFCDQMVPVSITPRQRLDDVVLRLDNLRFGGTDCALPMLAATAERLEIDAFIVYTDNETWAGHIHPVQALQQYRQKTGIPATLVVVGMVSNGFSIADPNDGGMMDVVGFDTATPNVISDFVRGGSNERREEEED